MKFLLVCLATLVVANATPLYDADSKQLEADFQDFSDLIPWLDVFDILAKYKNDKEILKVQQYTLSEEFHELIYAVEDLKEFQEYVLSLEEVGTGIIERLESIHKMLGMKEYVPPKASHDVERRSVGTHKGKLNAFIDEIIQILPADKIKELYNKKLQESTAFAKFIAHINSEKFQKIVESLTTHKTYVKFIQESKAAGLDIAKVSELFAKIIGID